MPATIQQRSKVNLSAPPATTTRDGSSEARLAAVVEAAYLLEARTR